MGYWFEDLRNDFHSTSAGRTLTETDVVMFAAMSGDYSQVHTDEEYCRNTDFGTRIAHGLLGLSIAQGLMWRTNYTQGTGVASIGWRDWQFRRPLLIGDTVHVDWSITSARESRSRADRGIVVESVKLLNQRSEVVQEGEHVLMVRRNPDGSQG